MTIDSSLEFIYRLGDETRVLTEPEDIMASVSESLGRYLSASRCAYADVESDGSHFTIHRDYTDNCASTAGKYDLSAFGQRALELLQRGETLIINNVDAEVPAADGGDTFRAIGIQAIVCCSLVKNGRLVAMMAVHQIEPRQWGEDEIALMHEVVERCWSTIERAKAQKTAVQNELKFKALFEYAPDAQVLVDRHGVIQLVNERFADMVGIAPIGLVGRPAVELLPATIIESNFLPNSPFTKISSLQSQTVPQFQIQNAAGNKLYVEISQNAIQTDDDVLRALSIRDVSERIRLENELLQAKKIETLGMLAGGIAHDFNNLLTVIIGTAELPLHKDKTDFKFRKELETIRKVGARAGELTQQLLAFSRQQVLQPEVIDLNVVLQLSQDILSRLIGESISVELELEPNLASVNLDKTQMEQVLMNLAANARDAMPDGGKLTVATGVVSMLPESLRTDAEDRQDFVRLSVTDTGSGMSEEQIAKIFDPFYTTKGTGKGTGLGLSTVYGIVTQSDGHIAVRSEPGSGTSFEMYFPSVVGLPKSRIETNKKASAKISENILIAEDEPALREVLNQLLVEFGYTVEAASDGRQALDIFAKKPDHFDLIITDVIMPVMNGPEFIKQVRQLRPNVKVIFSSGYTADSIGHHGVLESDQNFLSKPYSYEVLEDTVRGVLAA